MPVRAPELTIRHHRQANRLLPSDSFGNPAVLDPLQLTGRQTTLSVRGARLGQACRAQQAADMIGTIRELLVG